MLALAAAIYEGIPGEQRERADKTGRDTVLGAPIAGLSPDEQAVVASVLAFQRRKLQPQREPAFLRLDKDGQEAALTLAAILALAAELDPAAHAISVEAGDGTTTVRVAGTTAAEAVAVAAPYVDRWTKQIGPLDLQSLPAPAEQTGELPESGEGGALPDAVSDLKLPALATMGDPEAAVAEAARQRRYEL